MPPPKLHLNEHLSPRLAQQLRRHSFDVTSTLESDLVSTSDREQKVSLCSGKNTRLPITHIKK